MLLDTPFQEIRTLRFDDKGVLYVAAVNGRATSGAAPSVPTDTGSPGSPGDAVARAGAVGLRLHRNHRDRRRRHAGRERSGTSRVDDAARPKARSIASRPTACGISCGNRATTRRTIWRSTPTDA